MHSLLSEYERVILLVHARHCKKPKVEDGSYDKKRYGLTHFPYLQSDFFPSDVRAFSFFPLRRQSPNLLQISTDDRP